LFYPSSKGNRILKASHYGAAGQILMMGRGLTVAVAVYNTRTAGQHASGDKQLINLAVIFIRHFIIKVIKSRRMRWAGHVAHTGDDKCI
jgi:hypothetical protein